MEKILFYLLYAAILFTPGEMAIWKTCTRKDCLTEETPFIVQKVLLCCTWLRYARLSCPRLHWPLEETVETVVPYSVELNIQA